MTKSHAAYERKRNRSPRHMNLWETDYLAKQAYDSNISQLLALAMNRFRWVNLPDTCDARFLEMNLHRRGMATICRNGEGGVWQTLIASPFGGYNIYGIPTSWKAQGYATSELYDVTPDNGEIVFYSQSRQNPWVALDYFALRLTHYDLTEQNNLTHQSKPWVFVAPPEKKLELQNMLKSVMGNEPAVLGSESMLDITDKITAIDTKVPLVTEELALSRMNVFNQALLYLGIPHLAFEKGERMIEDEARANTMPTNIMLLDCLNARRQAADELNRRFGLNIEVYLNDDFESYNFNYVNNVEAITQDGYGSQDTEGSNANDE